MQARLYSSSEAENVGDVRCFTLMDLIDAATLTPDQQARLLRLLRLDTLEESTVSVEVRWRSGYVESTRVSPQSAAEIERLVMR